MPDLEEKIRNLEVLLKLVHTKNEECKDMMKEIKRRFKLIEKHSHDDETTEQEKALFSKAVVECKIGVTNTEKLIERISEDLQTLTKRRRIYRYRFRLS